MAGWAGLVGLAREERRHFLSLAARARRERIQANKEKRFLDALRHQRCEDEYRRSAAQKAAFIDEHKGKP